MVNNEKISSERFVIIIECISSVGGDVSVCRLARLRGGGRGEWDYIKSKRIAVTPLGTLDDVPSINSALPVSLLCANLPSRIYVMSESAIGEREGATGLCDNLLSFRSLDINTRISLIFYLKVKYHCYYNCWLGEFICYLCQYVCRKQR